MTVFELLLVSVLSLIFGSFVGAVSYRIPRKMSFLKGRSICDSCKKKIPWFNNIPLFSFLLLSGKSSCCGRKISKRYPLIEGASLLGGLFVFYFSSSYVYLILFYLLLNILVTDIEHMLIFDLNVFLLLLLGVLYVLTIEPDLLFPALFAGFASSLFLLAINLFTKGKGMGLGDVKLAASLGFWMGSSKAFEWMILSFLTGGVVASILLLTGKAGLKKRVPFGPFLIASFLVCLLFDLNILSFLVKRTK